MFNPIAVEERIVKRLKKNSGVARAEKKVVTKVPNPGVKTSNVLSEFLILSDLADDTIPFDAALIATSNNMEI